MESVVVLLLSVELDAVVVLVIVVLSVDIATKEGLMWKGGGVTVLGCIGVISSSSDQFASGSHVVGDAT